MKPIVRVGEALLELIYPERCVLCGIDHREDLWCPRGARVPGLRLWDGTHLCQTCATMFADRMIQGELRVGSLTGIPITAAAPTHRDLVKLVGQFKYHGLRGLAWPLARLLRIPLTVARAGSGKVDALIPVPLHPRKKRTRGFNQAEILVRLLGQEAGIPVRTDVLSRRRNTAQQAKISAEAERRRNLAAGFAARPTGPCAKASQEGGNVVGLVDDLVTSGWTVAAAVASLSAAGWDVRWVVALGLARNSKNQGRCVDTWKGGF